MKENGAPLLYRFGTRARTVCLSAVLFAISGCVVEDHKQNRVVEPPVNQTQPLAAAPLEVRHESEQAKTQESVPELPNGTGQTAWVRGSEGELIMGLDGEVYDAYNEATIRDVQMVMKKRGLYGGPINGVLDPPTMDSIYTFQEANKYLLRSGVPSPRTRKLLEQGSHTDVPS